MSFSGALTRALSMHAADAMDEMGDQLSPGTLEAITVAFDLHGAIDFEQFKEIVSVGLPPSPLASASPS